VFLDAETNVATLARVRRRIVDSKGRLYNDDMILVTSNAAQSIARRNAILAGIPKAIWSHAYSGARYVVMGDIKTLANRRAEAITAFQRFGITAEQLFQALGVKGEEDIDQERLVSLRSSFKHIKAGEMTVEEFMRGGDRASAEPAKLAVDNPFKDDPPATAGKEAAPAGESSPPAGAQAGPESAAKSGPATSSPKRKSALHDLGDGGEGQPG
jgi:hypothetical protein